jgi:hypothetical protein
MQRLKEIEETRKVKFIPGVGQVKEIIELFILPSINLKNQLGDILVKLRRHIANEILVI